MSPRSQVSSRGPTYHYPSAQASTLQVKGTRVGGVKETRPKKSPVGSLLAKLYPKLTPLCRAKVISTGMKVLGQKQNLTMRVEPVDPTSPSPTHDPRPVTLRQAQGSALPAWSGGVYAARGCFGVLRTPQHDTAICHSEPFNFAQDRLREESPHCISLVRCSGKQTVTLRTRALFG
jgi:hypothetical protein